MKMEKRADFSAATRQIIAERAGYQCSVLNCGQRTVGPGPGQSRVSIGMAAHIYAASPGGPRGTGGLSAAERRAPENGIWCCYSHGKAIDSDTGNTFSAAQLKAWKRLHEARKSAEITGVPQDRFGLVESIAVNSAPVSSLTGRKFELGMRNIITGPNASGKTVLARFIASVAYPDHVAELSRHRNVDLEVKWFDPYTHDLATSGRSGLVNHVLDGQPVPYVARPYKTIMINDWEPHDCLGSIVTLSQMFDLSSSAMRGTLATLAESSRLVKEVKILGTRIEWVLDINGRTVSANSGRMSGNERCSIIFELVAVHARHHAQVEPTFLIIDGLLGYHATEAQIDALERMHTMAEHAQIAIICQRPDVIERLSREWALTELESDDRRSYSEARDCPIDFEIETTTTPQRPPIITEDVTSSGVDN
jgi:hypothetical protein